MSLVEVVVRVLEGAGRPLSLRKILEIAERERLVEGPRPTLTALRVALASDDGVVEVRRGIFGLLKGRGRGPGADPARSAPDPEPPHPDAAARADADETAGEDDTDGGPARRRRPTRARDWLGDAPSAPLTVEDAVAQAPEPEGRTAWRRALWERMQAHVTELVGADPAADDPAAGSVADPGPADPAPATASAGDPQPTRGEAEPDEGRADRDAQSEPADARTRLRSRLKARSRTVAPPALAEALTTEPRAEPYRERRAPVEPPTEGGDERRAPRLEETASPDDVVRAARAALESAAEPMTPGALANAIADVVARGSVGVRAALLAENARCAGAGLRGPFLFHASGHIGLTDWALGDAYRAFESDAQRALAAQREVVRRSLLERIAGLSDAGFEQVLVLLLERLGYCDVTVVHRAAGTIALAAQRALGGGAVATAVVGRRSWSAIGAGTLRALRESLPRLSATSGLVVSVGSFTEESIAEAGRPDAPTLMLVDGAGLASLLYEHGVGLVEHRPVVRFPDAAFFESLD
jgi:hypothetical protein